MSHDTKHCLALYSTVCTVYSSVQWGPRTEDGGGGAPGPSLQLTSARGHQTSPRLGKLQLQAVHPLIPIVSVRAEWQLRDSCLRSPWLQLLISGLTITNTKGHVHWFNNLLGPSTLHYIAFDLCYYLRLSHNKSTNQEAIGRYNPFSCLCSSYHLSHAEGVSFETLNLFLQSCITYICLGLVMIMIIFHRYFIPCSSSINAFIFI